MKSDCRFSKVFWFNWIFLVCFFYLHFHGLFDAFWCVGVWLWWAASHLFSFCSSYFRAVIKRAARIGRSVYILLRIGVPFSGQWERCQLWESSSYENGFFYTFRAFYGYFLMIALWFSWTCHWCSLKTHFICFQNIKWTVNQLEIGATLASNFILLIKTKQNYFLSTVKITYFFVTAITWDRNHIHHEKKTG